jgi:hypothetical protein
VGDFYMLLPGHVKGVGVQKVYLGLWCS